MIAIVGSVYNVCHCCNWSLPEVNSFAFFLMLWTCIMVFGNSWFYFRELIGAVLDNLSKTLEYTTRSKVIFLYIVYWPDSNISRSFLSHFYHKTLCHWRRWIYMSHLTKRLLIWTVCGGTNCTYTVLLGCLWCELGCSYWGDMFFFSLYLVTNF